MKKKYKITVCIIVLAITTSCTTYTVKSTTPLENKTISKNLGKSDGVHRTWSLFCLWMFKRPEIDSAIKDAVMKKGGDALINVAYYEYTLPFLLFSITTISVEGEVVKFSTTGVDNED